MGANLVAPIQQYSLVLTLVLAVVWLGEALTPLRAIGIILVVAGPALTHERQKSVAARTFGCRSGFQPIPSELSRRLCLRNALGRRLWHQSGSGWHGL